MTATRSNHFTTGRIYENVIRKERRGDYLGGAIGDIESLPFLEAIRQMSGVFTNVEPKAVINVPDADTIDRIPLLLHAQGVDDIVARKLRLDDLAPAKFRGLGASGAVYRNRHRPGGHRHGGQICGLGQRL